MFSARNLAPTSFLSPVITEAPSEEKLESFFLSIPASSSCATIAFVIASASAELEFPNRLLAAGKAVFALPVSGWTNLTNVTSYSLLDTSKNSSAKSPKHLAFNISCTNCAFKTLPMRRNVSLTEPVGTVFEILDIFKTYFLKKFQKTRELLFGDFLFRNPLHSKQRFVVNFIFSIFNFTHFFFKS